MTPRVRRAVAAVRRALDRQYREEAKLVGRWALDGGVRTLRVRRIDPATHLALVGNGGQCWHVPAAQLLALRAAKRLTYLGR